MTTNTTTSDTRIADSADAVLLLGVGHPRFPPGQLVSTPGALESVPRQELLHALHRHLTGDWGDVAPDDRAENDLAVREGFRLLSVYRTRSDRTFWILTEADRSVTTVLLPEEY